MFEICFLGDLSSLDCWLNTIREAREEVFSENDDVAFYTQLFALSHHNIPQEIARNLLSLSLSLYLFL